MRMCIEWGMAKNPFRFLEDRSLISSSGEGGLWRIRCPFLTDKKKRSNPPFRDSFLPSPLQGIFSIANLALGASRLEEWDRVATVSIEMNRCRTCVAFFFSRWTNWTGSSRPACWRRTTSRRGSTSSIRPLATRSSRIRPTKVSLRWKNWHLATQQQAHSFQQSLADDQSR